MAQAHPTIAAGPAWSGAARQAIRDQAHSTPEWRVWLGLLEIALTAAARDVWRGMGVQLAAGRPAGAPVLEGARITPPGAATDALVADLLLSVAPGDAGNGRPESRATGGLRSVDSLELLGCGVRHDRPGIDRLAAMAGVAGGVLATVAHFATLPVLLEAGRRAAERVPPDWRAGYCPVCAAWPTLVELRGLERRRVLRCGRCATGWQRDVLHCPFCGERDHRRQGALVPEEGGELLRMETCGSCHGYLKAVTTLRPGPFWVLPLEDLRTLELELSAIARGFRRPDRPAWPLRLALTPDGDGPVPTSRGRGP
jgi:FdhE protein